MHPDARSRLIFQLAGSFASHLLETMVEVRLRFESDLYGNVYKLGYEISDWYVFLALSATLNFAKCP